MRLDATDGRKTRTDFLVHVITGNPMKNHRAMQLRSVLPNSLKFTALFAGMSLVNGCNEKLDPNICASGEVYACAQLQTLILADSIALPPSHMVSVRVSAARTDATWGGEISPVPTVGPSQVNLYFHTPLTPTTVDTVTVWIVAQLIELPIPASPNVPFKTIAIDSTKHVLRVARSGARIAPDSVQLRLRKL